MGTGHEIAMELRAAYLSMHRQTNAHLLKYGVTADQFVCLVILSEEDGITQQELVRRATSDPNTIRAMLVLLEKAGLVARKKHPRDGRARSVTLTVKGRELYEQIWQEIKLMQKRLSGLFSGSEVDMFIDGLKRISAGMSSTPVKQIVESSHPVSENENGEKKAVHVKR